MQDWISVNSQKEKPKTVGFTGEFYKPFKEFASVPFKLFQEIEEGAFPVTFCEASITILPKPNKNAIKERKRKKLQTNIPCEYWCKKSPIKC